MAQDSAILAAPRASMRIDPGAARLRLEPAERLPMLAADIGALGEAAGAANPFFLPAFLAPAIQAFGRGAVELALLFERGELVFFAPVLRRGARARLARAVRVWTHPYAPLGMPLIRAGREREVARLLVAGLGESGRPLLVVPDVPLEAPQIRALAEAACAAGGMPLVAAPRARPILHADDPAGTGAIDRMVAKKRRKELSRQLRRLGDAAPVRLVTARGADAGPALRTFMALEASGWKGRRGTALASRDGLRIFAERAVGGMAAGGNAEVDILWCGDRPAAALVRLSSGGLSIPWKVAHDEAFAAYSPGAQIMLSAMHGWLADPDVRRVDPVCEEDNALLAHLWADAEPYGALLAAAPGGVLPARFWAAQDRAIERARPLARRLLRAFASAKRSPVVPGS